VAADQGGEGVGVAVAGEAVQQLGVGGRRVPLPQVAQDRLEG
jgi:hypothetical protein